MVFATFNVCYREQTSHLHISIRIWQLHVTKCVNSVTSCFFERSLTIVVGLESIFYVLQCFQSGGAC